MTLALALVFGTYAVLVLGIWVLLARQPRPAALPDADLPEAVVIVAARDEEATIGRCLAALRAQDYPASKLSIVVANDHSADRTAEVVAEAQAAAGGPEIRLLAVPDPVGELKAKALALHTAIEATTAPVLLFTDADCAPEPTWARALASRLTDPAAGIACGTTRLRPRPGRFFDRVQAVDWDLLLNLMAAVAEAKVPVGGMGNNMAVRREAYVACGGFPALPFSFTEDFLLVQAIHETGRPVEVWSTPATTVWSLPAEGPAETYHQRLRWAQGGLSGDRWVLLAYFVPFAVHALLVAGLVLTPGAGLAALGAKLGVEAIGLGVIRRRLGGRYDPLAFLANVAFMVGYLVTLPFVLSLRREIDWKGRRH